MKKMLVLGLLCMLVGCSDSTGGGKFTIANHENGKTASRGFLLNNEVKVGEWIYFYEDGLTLMKRGRYVNGKMHGQWSFMMPDATSPWTAEYEHGEGPRNGFEITYHENGQKSTEGLFKNSNKEGVWTDWHDNGQKRSEGTYKDGKEEGAFTAWHDNGQKCFEGPYKDGKPEGIWTEWDDKGNVTKTETWENGELIK